MKVLAEQSDPNRLLTPREVAAVFRVNPKTVSRWARSGRITAVRTLGGHRRFRAGEIARAIELTESHSLA
jgi:excisionase family DNA binding protein